MAADSVVLVFSSGSGTHFADRFSKIYYAGEQEVGNNRDTFATTKPQFDDDIQKAKHFAPEHAVSVRNLFRNRGYACHVEDRFGNILYEREESIESRYDDKRSRQFVPFTNGLGLIVVPGNTPSGPVWFVRASDIPSFVAEGKNMVIESVSGQTPQEAAQRAVDTFGPQILFGDPEATRKAELERQQVAERAQERRFAGLRPGDR